jgi:Rrf2 family protein
MLKLTRKLEYALIALRHMQDKKDTFISAKEMADMYLIPQELFAKILQQMAKLNYIKAAQGPRGGYRMRKDLTEISLTQFIEDIEGPIGLVDCTINSDCVQLDNCNIRMPIKQINNNIRAIFNGIRIDDITS